MSDATDILRSYVRLVERLSGAASVSLYVPPGPGGESEILLHDGHFEPVPELADAAAAAELHHRFIDEHGDNEEGAVRLPSRSPDGVLYRIPLRWVFTMAEEDAGGPERRKRDGRRRAELTAGTGLGFARDASARRQDGLLYCPTAADTLSDEAWWKNFLGLAAAFAAHARTVSRTLFDQVTGLPERPEFQAELESALAQAEEGKVSTVLVLLGPDDFGWVNERLDRRSGDLVLREIATGLRASLRSHDHIARYGGGDFSPVLLPTGTDGGGVVGPELVPRGRRRPHPRGGPRLFKVTPLDLAIVERACQERNFVAEGGGVEPGDLSLCALPLFLQGQCLGGIVLEVASVNVSFEGSDRRFLDALASEMAMA